MTNYYHQQRRGPPHKWLRVFWQVFVCLFVPLSQQNLVSTITTVRDPDMKLGRCVLADFKQFIIYMAKKQMAKRL